MDAPRILEIFEESRAFIDKRSCDELMQWMNFVEYVVIEEKKNRIIHEKAKLYMYGK